MFLWKHICGHINDEKEHMPLEATQRLQIIDFKYHKILLDQKNSRIPHSNSNRWLQT
jgi:hypothetical protein